MATVYFAKWILAPDGETLVNGGIAVTGDRISSIGSRSRLKRSSSDRIVNLGEMLLLPGLINMHTHLEEGVLRGMPKADDESFASWIAKRSSRLRASGADAIMATVRLGIREALANGITTVVDSTRTDIPGLVLKEEPIRSWTIHELHPDAETDERDSTRSLSHRIKRSRRTAAIGAGPYALFSLSPEAHRSLIAFCRERSLVWGMHLAESAEELQAFSEQRGDLYFGIVRARRWPFGAATRRGPAYYALTNNLIPNGGVCFHGNYISGQEMSLLAAKNCSLVHCAQYNDFMGHKPFPLDAAVNRGVNVCLGAESPCSGMSTSLFDELFRIKQAYPHIPAREMLAWATVNPARALGAGNDLGALAPGSKADVIGVRFAHDSRADILEELLMEEPQIEFVMVDGEEIIVG